MSAVEAVPMDAGSKHPLRVAMERRDIDALVATLADDVVFYSPVATKPFVGIEEVAEVIEVIMRSFEELEYPEEWISGSTEIVTFRGRMAGRFVEGAEMLRHDEDGKVRKIEIFARPMTGSFSVARAVGPPLARRRSRARAAGVWLLSRFGPVVVEWSERAADRLYRRPRA